MFLLQLLKYGWVPGSLREQWDDWTGYHLFGPFVLAETTFILTNIFGFLSIGSLVIISSIVSLIAIILWELGDFWMFSQTYDADRLTTYMTKYNCESWQYKFRRFLYRNIFDKRGISSLDLVCGFVSVLFWVFLKLVYILSSP